MIKELKVYFCFAVVFEHSKRIIKELNNAIIDANSRENNLY